MNSVPAPPRARNVAKGPNSLSSLGRSSDLRASRRWRGGRTRRSHAIEATPRARRPRVPLLRVDARLWVSSLLHSAAAARAGACPGRFRREFRSRWRVSDTFRFEGRPHVGASGRDVRSRRRGPAWRVLMRSWAADASLSVLGVLDASFEPWSGWFRGGACSHQPRSTELRETRIDAAALRVNAPCNNC